MSCIAETTTPESFLKYSRKSSLYNDPRCSLWYDILRRWVNVDNDVSLSKSTLMFDLVEIRVLNEAVGRYWFPIDVSWSFNNFLWSQLNFPLGLWRIGWDVELEEPKVEIALIDVDLCARDKRVMEKENI